MKPLISLLTEEVIEDLASRGNFRYGKEIAEEANFTIEKSNTFNVAAKVKFRNNETRTVELMSTVKGLRFKCTCTSKKNFFCQHCTGLALHIIRK